MHDVTLREKAMRALDSGSNQYEVSKLFGVNKGTLSNWRKLYKETGSYAPRGYPGKAANLQESDLLTYLKKNPNALLSEIGAHFSMTYGGAAYWMKKIGYSYKKKRSPTWKLVK